MIYHVGLVNFKSDVSRKLVIYHASFTSFEGNTSCKLMIYHAGLMGFGRDISHKFLKEYITQTGDISREALGR
jgi:hypothetical protein